MSSTKLVALLMVAVVVMTTVSDAYVYTKIASEFDGQCKDDNGVLHKESESWTYEKRCELATCTRVDGKLYEEVVGCVKVTAQKGCRLYPRLNGSAYPSCCPALRCNVFIDDNEDPRPTSESDRPTESVLQ